MTEYTGQLENVDAFNYGVRLRKEEKSCFDFDNNPVNSYFSFNGDDIDFLDKWSEEMIRGWRKQDNIISKERFQRLLLEFKKVIPQVGDVVYVEHPNNLRTYYKCLVEFVPPEQDQLLVRYLDDKDLGYGQSKLALLCYSYSTEYGKAIFPIFHVNLPN